MRAPVRSWMLDLRAVVRFVALANLAFFGLEFAVALAVKSVSLFADSVDFLEDASVNFLVLLALGWSLRWRIRVSMALTASILIPGLATLWMAWLKFHAPAPPQPVSLSLTGLAALLVNLACAWLLARHRRKGGSLVMAAFLSARNDVFANVAIVAAGAATAWTDSGWPDLLVGLGIALLNAGAARTVWRAARAEGRSQP